MIRLFSIIFERANPTTIGLTFLISIFLSKSYAQVQLISSGPINSFALNYPANLQSYPSGLSVMFLSNQNNTSSSTLSLNGMAPKNIYKNVNMPLIANDILNGQAVTLIYDGTNFQMLSNSANTPTSNLWTISGTHLYPSDLNGNVGIGTSSPFNALSLVGNTVPAVDLGTFLDIQNTNGNQGALAGIRFKANSVTTDFRYNFAIFNYWNQLSTVAANNMGFAVKSNNTAANVSTADIKMNITDAGNVGIGTQNPQSTLDVKGNIQISNASIPMGLMTEVLGITPILNLSVNFRETNKNISYRGGAVRIDTRYANGTIPMFQFLSRSPGSTFDNLTLVSITEDGNMGIGTTKPSAKLDVDAGSILINSTIGSASSRPPVTSIRIDGEISARGVGGSNSLISDDGFLRLSAGGGTNTSNKSYIDISGYSTVSGMANNIVLGTSGSEKMRILSNGNVGIGTTSPIAALDVNGSISITSSTGKVTRINSGSSNNLVPLAYFYVKGGATPVVSGNTSNVAFSNRVGTGFYEFNITGENFTTATIVNYVIVATLQGLIAGGSIRSGAGTGVPNTLRINTYNNAGTATDYNYSVVIYKQ